MCLGIFVSCFSCCYSAETLYGMGNRPFREGTRMLERESQPRQKQRAYELITEGLSYYRRAESRYVELDTSIDSYISYSQFHEVGFARKAQILIASFCASSTCSKELKNYLIKHGIFTEDAFKRYRHLFHQNKFNLAYAYDRYRGSKADEIAYKKEWDALEEQRKPEREKEQKAREESEKRDAERRAQREHEEWLRRSERERYEREHPEVKYQREAAEAAREQVELLREQNEILSARAAEQARQSSEQTRLLQETANYAYAAYRDSW